MSALAFRLCTAADAPAVRAFMDAHWGEKHPLVACEDFFNYYYVEGERLQFAFAEQDGAPVALAGYILANRCAQPDIWVSIWCAARGCNGAGLELMDALPALTGARVMACNNIRPKTMAFYRFLGYTAERVPHYYRLADREKYAVARIAEKKILPVAQSGDALVKIESAAQLTAEYAPDETLRPFKDAWYLARRYFAFPHQQYDVYGVYEQGRAVRLVVTRTVPLNGTAVLRIVDYIGAPAAFARLGPALDALLREAQAEYAECYCWGVPAEAFAQAGFCERREEDVNVLPNYLTPPRYENTEYYFFTSDPAHFTLFKADGDQDRPNIALT